MYPTAIIPVVEIILERRRLAQEVVHHVVAVRIGRLDGRRRRVVPHRTGQPVPPVVPVNNRLPPLVFPRLKQRRDCHIFCPIFPLPLDAQDF